MACLTPLDKALLLLRRAVTPANANTTTDSSASTLLLNANPPASTDPDAPVSSTGTQSLPTTFSSPTSLSSTAPSLSSASALSLASQPAMSSPSDLGSDPLLLQTATASTLSSSRSNFSSDSQSQSSETSSFAESSDFSSAAPSSQAFSSSEALLSFSSSGASLSASASSLTSSSQFLSSAFLLLAPSSSSFELSSTVPSSSFPSFSSVAPSTRSSSSPVSRSTLQPSSTSSSSSLSSSSLQKSQTSSFVPYTSTLSVSPDTTITTLITVPTAAQDITSSDNHQSTAQKNSKLIGGLVGSIGGTIVIGSLVLLFLFLKKRKRSSYTNQSPDFNDDTSGEDGYNDKFGFKKLLGSKNTANTLGAGAAAAEHDRNARGFQTGPFAEPVDDDFQYRGVTNSNNLDSIFRSTATNSTGPNSGQISARVGHSRYGSVANHMSTMPENRGNYDSTNEYGSAAAADSYGHSREHSDDTEGGFHPSDYEIYDEELPLPHINRNSDVFGNEVHSNNLRSRFTEEI